MTATTISNTERREVAARLREMGLNPWDDAACEIAQCAGIVCCNSECHGSDETPECTMALCARLADLIEPSEHECVPGECPINVRHDNDRIDRDALLALADELENDGMDHYIVSTQYVLDDYARRIREALGVDDG